MVVTKNIVRKDGLASYEADGDGQHFHSHSQHQQHLHQPHEGNGFAIPQHHQPLALPMHPLAPPPPKKVKLNHRYNNSSSTAQHQNNLQRSQFGGDHPTPIMAPPASAKRPRPLAAKKRRSPHTTAAVSNVQQQVLPALVNNARGTTIAAPPLQNPYSTSRGLRHFSMKVCEKVEERGTTTYNEVADELVRELKAAEEAIKMAAIARGEVPVKKKINKNSSERSGKTKKNHDDKNIRRRVYDALNVLMAMDIITKDKKEITWRGLPGRQVQDHLGDGSGTTTGDNNGNTQRKNANHGLSRRQRMQQMQEEFTKRQDDIRRKRECLQELMVQNVCYQNLLGRNHARQMEEMTRTATAAQHGESSKEQPDGKQDCDVKEIKDEKIPLPFIIVNTDSRAVVQCEMCPERTNVSFDFSLPFEINDDNEILKRLGMNRTSKEALQRSLPPDLFQYCNAKGLLQSIARVR